MLHSIISWLLHNRLVTGILFLAVVVLGGWMIMNTPVDAIPDLSENQVIVMTEWFEAAVSIARVFVAPAINERGS